MTKVKEIMSTPMAVVDDDTSVERAAVLLAQSDVEAVPVRGGADARLKGMLTDRDIVVRVVARGLAPASVTVGELMTDGGVVTVGADDSVEEAIEAMKRHKVRRLPVLDGHELTGILTQADIARSQPDAQVAALLVAVSS
jgi:CBS domain-containing protein